MLKTLYEKGLEGEYQNNLFNKYANGVNVGFLSGYKDYWGKVDR